MRTWRHLIAALAVASCAAAAAAEPVVLKAARYFDATTGALVSPALIWVEDGVIAGVNPQQPPPNAVTIDLGDLTVLPGLIDAHTHLTQEISRAAPLQSPSHGAADLALQGAHGASKTLQAGFTTVRDLGATAFADVALRSAIEKNWVAGPDVIPAGNGIGISGGHCDGVSAGEHRNATPMDGAADGVAEVTKAVRLQVKHGAKVIKICVTAGVMSAGNSLDAVQMTDEEIAAAVAEAHRQGLRIAAHAHGAAGIIAAAKAGVDSIEHASFLTSDTLRLIQEKKVTLVPTLYLLSTFDLNQLPERLRSPAQALKRNAESGFQKALAAHANIVFGSDASVIPHGENAREFATRVSLGQSTKDALLSATSRAASLLGLSDRGLIATGRRADLIAVEGDPLANIRTLENVRFVMKQGRVFKDIQRVDAAYDLVIKRGRVMDPQSGFDATADVAVRGDTIVAVSTEPLRGRKEIDAAGLVVAPGFIDLHAHDQNRQTDRLHALDGVTTVLELEGGAFPIEDWYREREGQAAINYGASVSHAIARALAFGTIERRDLTGGADAIRAKLERRPEWATQAASAVQLERLKALMTEGAQAGGVGFGYHLATTTGASPAEMLELYALSVIMGAPNFIHIRSPGHATPLEAGREVIEAARTTGASIHIVHVNSSGLWETRPLLDALYTAQRAGLDVSTEAYPYTGAHSSMDDPRASAEGFAAFHADYSDLELMETGERLTENRFRALKQSKSRAELIAHIMDQEDVDLAVAHPMVMIASDGVAFHQDNGHPRSSGTFARILGHYVRHKRSLTLMQALAKMTLMPAQRLEASTPQMRLRGRLQPGMIADITVFDAARVADRATYRRPLEPSAGVIHVLVSGTAVVENSVFQNNRFPGRAIRRASPTSRTGQSL